MSLKFSLVTSHKTRIELLGLKQNRKGESCKIRNMSKQHWLSLCKILFTGVFIFLCASFDASHDYIYIYEEEKYMTPKNRFKKINRFEISRPRAFNCP